MNSFRRLGICCGLLAAALLAGCVSSPRTVPTPTPLPEIPGPVPPSDAGIGEVVPKAEPRSRKGNPPFYQVFGKRYFVLPDAAGYSERGVASWYGPGFHAADTANGERYDMYAMSAAHKTLPLPTYVLVTNLRNGRSITVRVNDRGPFKDTRIIDLSYSAAMKLDMIREGTAFVEVRALTPGQAPVAPSPGAAQSLFVQAGAFGTEANALRLVTQLRAKGLGNAFVRQDLVGGQTMFRVRVGPIPSVDEFDKALARLKSLGFADARLASD
ncbi:MAG: septal ring lytic transglycosylase RlpA family protein [Steroidobacteraceae bacterium]